MTSEREPRCPVCRSPDRPRFEVDGYPLRACPTCTHQYFTVTPAPDHVERLYGDDYFHGGGAGYPDYLAEGDLLRRRGRAYAEKLSKLPRGRLLDVGAAAGFILAGFRDAGWTVEGVEPNGRMARHAREVLGLPVTTSRLEHFSSAGRFDVVCMIQVIAHFAEPRAALDQARRLLNPGGHLLIETWNSDSWTARLLGRRWHELSPPTVLHCFSSASLVRLLGVTGFVPVAQGRPSKWLTVEHAKSVLRHKLGPRNWAERVASLLPGSWAVPYPADDLGWWLARKA